MYYFLLLYDSLLNEFTNKLLYFFKFVIALIVMEPIWKNSSFFRYRFIKLNNTNQQLLQYFAEPERSADLFQLLPFVELVSYKF